MNDNLRYLCSNHYPTVVYVRRADPGFACESCGNPATAYVERSELRERQLTILGALSDWFLVFETTTNIRKHDIVKQLLSELRGTL